MLKPRIPLVLAFGVTAAWADFVQEQRIEGPGVSGVSSIKLKGQKMRLERPVKGGIETALIDGKTGKLVMLIHKDKVALVSTMEEILLRPNSLLKNLPKGEGDEV